MSATADPAGSDPVADDGQAAAAAGTSARIRLEEAVGRELAVRLVSALTGDHTRVDDPAA